MSDRERIFWNVWFSVMALVFVIALANLAFAVYMMIRYVVAL
jgi:hypothetical protein